MISIIDTPEEYRLRILAEECAELAQAALKMIRANVCYSETSVNEQEALENLIEESADVILCIKSVLTEEQLEGVKAIETKKFSRWEQRLNNWYAQILQDGQE